MAKQLNPHAFEFDAPVKDAVILPERVFTSARRNKTDAKYPFGYTLAGVTLFCLAFWGGLGFLLMH